MGSQHHAAERVVDHDGVVVEFFGVLEDLGVVLTYHVLASLWEVFLSEVCKLAAIIRTESVVFSILQGPERARATYTRSIFSLMDMPEVNIGSSVPTASTFFFASSYPSRAKQSNTTFPRASGR